jgi:uncharacterized repeat protein (TIGR03806 family)
MSKFNIFTRYLPSSLLLALLMSCGGNSDDLEPKIVSQCGETIATAGVNSSDFGLDERIPASCLKISADIGLLSDIQIVDAYQNLTFDRPVDVVQVPGTNYIVVVQHAGLVQIFENNADVQTTSLFLDLTSIVRFDGNELGLVKLTFDTDYQNNGFFYVTYSGQQAIWPDQCTPDCSVVSRFTASPDNLLIADISSEENILVIPQPSQYHNADNLHFGPDGYLYIGVGDGGFFGDPNDPQNRTNILGSILRIDVSQGLPYRIPSDNPFANEILEVEGIVGAGQSIRQEIWAYGLRNPHRFSIDPVTGEMLAGDVGQNSREELDLIEAGKNYGWGAFEGSIETGRDLGGRDISEATPPLHEYDRSIGKSIIGGYVYRGTKFPSLYGSYIYGDFSAGTIWALDKDENHVVTENIELANAGGFSVASFGLIDNEIYFTNVSSASIQKFAPGDDMVETMPELLSAAGVFGSLAPLIAAPGVIPYDVNTALWSDGTEKTRWMVVPENEQIVFGESAEWSFPLGSVLVKHFAIDTDKTDPGNALLKLETRLMVHTTNGWIGYTYRWNDAQDEAELLNVGQWQKLNIVTDDGVLVQNYYYPATADCSRCHNPTEGFVLGPRTAQLNGDYSYGEVSDNQLRALNHINMFTIDVLAPSEYTHSYVSLGDDSAPLEARARSYLAANCAHCHNVDNALPTPLDFRYRNDSLVLNAINLEANNGLGLDNAKIINPGSKETSILWLRMQSVDELRMPPLATSVVDQHAVDLIGQWIDSL